MSYSSNLLEASGTFFTAFTAGASWLSVIRSQRATRESHLPNLQASVIRVLGADASDRGHTSLVILNAGTGVAKSVACVLAGGENEYVANDIGSGFLLYQKDARVDTEMPPHPDTKALVMCRDLGKRIWAWDLHGNCRSYDGNNLDLETDLQRIWSDFYKDDLDTRSRVGSRVAVTI
jgi:hypothetical protein